MPKTYAKSEHAIILALPPSPSVLDGNTLFVSKTIDWRPKGTVGMVPLNQEAQSILQKRKKRGVESPFVFAHPDGGPLRSDYWEQLKRVLEAAKLPKRVRVHDLRHTVAVRLRDRGVPLEAIMRILRHADISETLRYARPTARQCAESMEKLTTMRLVTSASA